MWPGPRDCRPRPLDKKGEEPLPEEGDREKPGARSRRPYVPLPTPSPLMPALGPHVAENNEGLQSSGGVSTHTPDRDSHFNAFTEGN